jgi:TetR/AcrR family transcriptional regulator, lmrAB and yxaGH operons repressor
MEMEMADPTDSRTRLLEATADLLADRGVHATGMKDILDTSDTVAGSLYHHFPGGKDELVACAARLAADEIDARMAAALEALPLTEAIDQFYASYIERLRESGYTTGCPIGTAAAEVASLSGPVAEVLAESLQRWTRTVATALRRHGWPSDQADETASLLTSLHQGALLVARAEHDTTPMEVAARQSRRLVEAGPVA